ncbi:MAG: histidine kinase [Allomuricauda sp.]
MFFKGFLAVALAVALPLSFSQDESKKGQFEIALDFMVLKAQEGQFTFQQALDSLQKTKMPKVISERTGPDDLYWILIDVLDDASRENAINNKSYLKFNTFDHGFIYLNNQGKIIKKPIGQFEKESLARKIDFSNYYSFLGVSKNDLINSRYILLNVRRITFLEEIKNWQFSLQNLNPNSYLDTKSVTQQAPFLFFTGVCFIMLFFSLSMFMFRKSFEFLYYSLYLSAMFVYLTDSHFKTLQFLQLVGSSFYYWAGQGFLFLSYVFYALFLIYYLNTKRNYRILHSLCLQAVVLNVAIVGLMVTFYVLDYYRGLIFIVSNGQKILSLYAIVGCALLLFVHKNTLMYVVILATTALALGGLARYYWAPQYDGLYLNSLYYMVLGSSVEIIIFAFGLNYKANTEFRENFRLKEEALINKIKALRAQMNPHFIFNALGSIQHLILQEKNPSALEYLSKFSRLIRNVLESSIEDHATLDEEVKMLKDYLELESLRFDNVFSYRLEIDKNIAPYEIVIPFMISQPFVENAIIHGLLPKKTGAKELLVHFQIQDNTLLCTIEDTGIGRPKSNQTSSLRQSTKKSRGLIVTNARLESWPYGSGKVGFVDKVDDNGVALGTKVTVTIPLKPNAFS